jgi:hypothetical protein
MIFRAAYRINSPPPHSKQLKTENKLLTKTAFSKSPQVTLIKRIFLRGVAGGQQPPCICDFSPSKKRGQP